MRALRKNYPQSPRKVRLVADMIRGKKVDEALAALEFTPKRSSEEVAKVLRSAIANAVASGKKRERLVIDTIAVDKGMVLRRFMPRARGAASPINRRTSHISIVLSERG